MNSCKPSVLGILVQLKIGFPEKSSNFADRNPRDTSPDSLLSSPDPVVSITGVRVIPVDTGICLVCDKQQLSTTAKIILPQLAINWPLLFTMCFTRILVGDAMGLTGNLVAGVRYTDSSDEPVLRLFSET